MVLLFTFLSFILGFLPGLLVSNFSNAQTKASDTVSKNDINSLYQKLEEHYNNYNEYPTVDELLYESEEALPGLDTQALYDGNDLLINSGDYSYTPTDCTALGCAHYELSAYLSDGTVYTKTSLN